MTDVVRVDPHAPDPGAIGRASACLRAGGLVAFPTETVYGLGADALSPEAVRRLFAAKQRPAEDPLIVHVLSLEDAATLVADVPAAARTLAARFWPGPLTLVLRRTPLVPDAVTAGMDTVAVRAPAHPVARALIAAAGLPVAAPSANLFSRPSPTSAAHVLEDLNGRIDLVLDAGPTRVGVESTVLDLSRGVGTILRPGAVTADMLRGVLPLIEAPASGEPVTGEHRAMRSPGLLAKHYSPRAPLTLFEGEPGRVRTALFDAARAVLRAGRRPGLLLADEDVERLPSDLDASGTVVVCSLGREQDVDTVASRLYAALRDLDNAEPDVILARDVATGTGLGAAIGDRLRRAAAGRVVQC